MKRLYKIKIKLVALGSLALLLTPSSASAGVFDVIPSIPDLIIGLFRSITYVFNFIGGIFFALAGMLANLMLSLNLTVLDDSNTLVHVGWQLVRDIANLGFVMVIIIIAFATILRFEQYGVTKLLPKLIAAAIIVNFSFAIAAVFINFTNILTDFFAERALPEATIGLPGWDLSTSLSSAFGPQRFFIDDGANPAEEDVGGAAEFGAATLTSVAGLVFTVIFTLIAAFVVLAFALMLLLRYLYLTFLVIVSPVIWLFWVIPILRSQFSKWWSSFLKWAFFAPAMMFFVYLALISVDGIGKIGLDLKNTGNFVSGILQNVMIQGAQMVVLSGILIGGLIISQKMGVAGAQGALGLASIAGKTGRAWAGRQAMRASSAPFRRGWGQKAVQGLQKAGTGAGGNALRRSLRQVGKFTGVNTLTRTLGNTLSDVGVVQGENLVKDAEDRQKRLSDDQLAIRVAGMNNFERIAALTRLSKSKNLDKVPEVSRYISDPGTAQAYERFGRKSDYQDLEKTFGANTEMLNAVTDKGRKDAATRFFSTFSKGDLAKVQYNEIYGEKSEFGLSGTDHELLQKAITHGIAVNNPGDLRKAFANVKANNVGRVRDRASEVEVEVRPKNADLADGIKEVFTKNFTRFKSGELFEFNPTGDSGSTT